MTWAILQKESFLIDYGELPRDLQRRVVDAINDLQRDPVTTRGNTIKVMKGYDNVWRYRLGDHRLIYAVAPEARTFQLLAVGPRGSVYSRFDYDGWDSAGADISFGPELAARLAPQQQAAPEWMAHPEWMQPPAAAEKAGEKAWLPRRITTEMLTRLHIPEKYQPVFRACETENDLLAAAAPQGLVERVLNAVYPPSVGKIAQQPDRVLFNPADLERYAAGALSSFLLHLDPQQQQFTDWALAGPTLVKGGPGSGKSTVALYRVRALMEHHRATAGDPDNVPAILFTTYTNALINASESLLRQLLAAPLGLAADDELPAALRISTLDKIVIWIVQQSGENIRLAGENDIRQALQQARRQIKPTGFGELAKMEMYNVLRPLRDDYLLQEFTWVVEGQQCRHEADYLAANRVGRGIPFSAKARRAVWALYTAYRDSLQEQGVTSWGMLRLRALELVRDGRFTPRWEFVIVDEAQDLTPAALALCVELARSPQGLFLTADANQSLYNRGFRWKDVHDQLQVTGRTRILQRNYRSTEEIAVAAADIMRPVTGQDPEALTQEYLHSGNPPAIYAAPGAAGQARWLARQLWQAAKDLRLPVNAAAVLVPAAALGRLLADQLSAEGLPARFTSSRELDLEERHVKVMTLHAAKGLEFPIVALAYVEAGRFPRDTAAAGREELAAHEANERRLFFVGCTRAMRHLFITHDRGLPSPFLGDLSEERWLKLEGE